MLILIPVNGTDPRTATIAPIYEATSWALIDFDEGVVKSTHFFADRHATGAEWIDFVILANKFENYMPFMEEGMMVLSVREEETLEEIIEAFKFKELDEVGY
jgi:predicted Fe-Mo cluster-binding NifX family protein